MFNTIVKTSNGTIRHMFFDRWTAEQVARHYLEKGPDDVRSVTVRPA